jgi:hypothetical protein
MNHENTYCSRRGIIRNRNRVRSTSREKEHVSVVNEKMKADSINHAFHSRMQDRLRQIAPDEHGNKVFQAKMIDTETKKITEVGPPILYKPSGKTDGEFIPATEDDEFNEGQYQKAGG